MSAVDNSTIGFGVAGSGNMARVYAEALAHQVTGARLVAAAGGTRVGEFAAEYGIDAEPSLESLLARDDISVVIVATPHSTHLPIAVAAAEAGRHVYLEKPMALDVDECDRIIEACRRAGVQLTIAKQTRHGDPEMRAKELIDEGAIGEIRLIRAMSPIAGLGIAPGNHWSFDRSEGAAFLDWGAHGCDAIRWLTGSEAVRVYADVANFGDLPFPDPTAMVQFRLASGAIAHLLMCYEIPLPGLGTNSNNQYQVVGSKGIIEFDLDTLRLGDEAGWRTIVDLPTWINPLQPNNPRRIKRSALQVQDFVDALHDGRSPAITGEDGRAAIAMASAAIESGATGQAVELSIPAPA
jgi:UDP-N-acetyl-2-amino-2-deoxyglucuronate dehydrogenase